MRQTQILNHKLIVLGKLSNEYFLEFYFLIHYFVHQILNAYGLTDRNDIRTEHAMEPHPCTATYKNSANLLQTMSQFQNFPNEMIHTCKHITFLEPGRVVLRTKNKSPCQATATRDEVLKKKKTLLCQATATQNVAFLGKRGPCQATAARDRYF